MTGSSWRNGRKIPGWVKLDLIGAGYLYYPETTPLDQALADARARGYDTAEATANLTDWVTTGKGARFTLS